MDEDASIPHGRSERYLGTPHSQLRVQIPRMAEMVEYGALSSVCEVVKHQLTL